MIPNAIPSFNFGLGETARTEATSVVIVGDDWGYTDFGFMGSKHVQTPRLDRFAAESLTF